MYSLDDFRSDIPSYEQDILQRNWIKFRPAVDTYQQSKYGGFPAPLAQTRPSVIPEHVCLANLSEEEIEFCGNLLFPGRVKQGHRTENAAIPVQSTVTGKNLIPLILKRFYFYFSFNHKVNFYIHHIKLCQ